MMNRASGPAAGEDSRINQMTCPLADERSDIADDRRLPGQPEVFVQVHQRGDSTRPRSTPRAPSRRAFWHTVGDEELADRSDADVEVDLWYSIATRVARR